MKIIKTASGKKKIKMSRKEWQSIGKKAGWDLPDPSWHSGPDYKPSNMEDIEEQIKKAIPFVEGDTETEITDLNNPERTAEFTAELFNLIKDELEYNDDEVSEDMVDATIELEIDMYLNKYRS